MHQNNLATSKRYSILTFSILGPCQSLKGRITQSYFEGIQAMVNPLHTPQLKSVNKVMRYLVNKINI